MKKILGMRKVLLGLVIGLLAAGGTATAASYYINGHRLVHRSVPPVALQPYAIYGSKLHAGSITYSKLGRTVKGYLAQHSAQGPKGDTGAQGPRGFAGAAGHKGDKGDTGATGATGPAGQALVANETTPPNDNVLGKRVVAVEGDSTTSTAPDSADPGTKLVSTTLDAGTYLVTGTAQFVNLNSAGGYPNKFGVAQLFLGDTTVVGGQIWTPAIPDSSSSVAQTNGTAVVTVATDGTTLSLNAVSRGGDGNAQGDVYGGANIIVTKITPSP